MIQRIEKIFIKFSDVFKFNIYMFCQLWLSIKSIPARLINLSEETDARGHKWHSYCASFRMIN